MHHQVGAARTILAAGVSPLEFRAVNIVPIRDLHQFPAKAAPLISSRALLHKFEIAFGTSLGKVCAVTESLGRGGIAMDWNGMQHL